MASYQASRPARYQPAPQKGSGALVKVIALFLGIAVGVLAIVAVVLMQAADEARDEVNAASATIDHSSHSAADTGAVSLPLQSFAGTTGANAEELAKAHVATDAALPTRRRR